MIRWLRNLFRSRPDPVASFRIDEALATWFHTASQSGMPKGLRWLKWTRIGEVLIDPAVALVPVQVEFEPIEGMGMEEVPQAREPRVVTVMFVCERGKWNLTGRTIFNLSSEQVMLNLSSANGIPSQ